MLSITHSHEAGTLIDGTSKGDGTAAVLKENGWRWGRSIAAWYVPHTRDHLPKMHVINRTADALKTAGFEVLTCITLDHRPAAEVEAGKIQRQGDRVTALEHKAERKTAADEAAWSNARQALDRLPEGGEPIKIGHHSENRHRNAIAKADRAMSRSIEATEEATRAQARADAAKKTVDARYQHLTVANRVEKIGAKIRRRQRMLDEWGQFNQGPSGPTAANEELRLRLEAEQAELRDQLTYWEAVRAEQIASGIASNHSRETIQKGDRVKIRGHWREVVRANPKTVSVTTGYSWTDTAPYAEIQQHHRPE